MSDFHLACANCGKQNLILEDDPWSVKCEFCGLPVRTKQPKKESTVKPPVTVRDSPSHVLSQTPAPLTPSPIQPTIKPAAIKRKERLQYLDAHREEITKDYYALKWYNWLEKWGLNNTSASNLLKLWKVKRKRYWVKTVPPSATAAPSRKPMHPWEQTAPAFKFPPIPDPLPPFNEAWPPEVKIGYFHARAIIALEEMLKIITSRTGDSKNARKA